MLKLFKLFTRQYRIFDDSSKNIFKMQRFVKRNASKFLETSDIVNGIKKAKMGQEDDEVSKTDLSAFSDSEDSSIFDFEFDSEGYVVVYTDGACRSNGKTEARAGLGVWFGDSHNLNISERVKGRQTNNTAEIQAAERAIRQAKHSGISKLKLMTDSKFTINCATKWLKNWKRNGWKLANCHDVKNREDLELLDKTMDGIEIKWTYVEAHKGIRGNEEADRLAVEGSRKT